VEDLVEPATDLGGSQAVEPTLEFEQFSPGLAVI
jgi:hypothetical protein